VGGKGIPVCLVPGTSKRGGLGGGGKGEGDSNRAMVRGCVVVDSQRQYGLGDRTTGETQVDGRGVATVPWVVGWYSRLIVEVEVVAFQPVDYRVGSSGGTSALREGTLPPHMVCIKVTHEDAVFRKLNVVYD
jgi:hypothetical protein